MNSLLLFVNSATQNSNELSPLLMSKLGVGIAIFSMLIIFSRISPPPSKQQTKVST